MNNFNEDIILEYLIENVDLSLNEKYSLKTVLMLDYCYKKDEKIPEDIIIGISSKIINKQINNSSKFLNLNESYLDNCLFLEAFKSLLDIKIKSLIENAKTPQDFKAIIIINEFYKNCDVSESFFVPSNDLDSKVFNLIKIYQENNTNKELEKEYLNEKKYFLKINEDLEKPLTKELTKKIDGIKKGLDEKSRKYSKYLNAKIVLEIQTLIKDANKSIEDKLEIFIRDLDEKYNNIRKKFDDNLWNNDKKINLLINLKLELKGIKNKYRLVSYKRGIKNCTILDSKIRNIVYNYEYVKDKKEEFKDVKRKVSDYRKEIESIFHKKIDDASVKRINKIHSDLKRLFYKEFNDCLPSAWQDDYYLNIETTLNYIKQEYIKKINFLTNQSSKYRQKIDSSFFSWQTKKFSKKLEEYTYELEVWSKCKII